MATGSYPIQVEDFGSYRWLLRETGASIKDANNEPIHGYNQDTWDDTYKGMVNSWVQSGYQQFLYPPPLTNLKHTTVEEAGEQGKSIETVKQQIRSAPHQWSFLSFVATLVTSSGKDTYTLPQNFGSVIGDFTGPNGRIPIVDETHVRSIAAQNAISGYPQYAGLRPLGTSGLWEVIFYPNPDNTYTLSYRYNKAQDPLSDENPWPLGGLQHAETVLQSCLAVAEERHNSALGVHYERWQERLSASIEIDRRAAKVTEETVWNTTGDGNNDNADHEIESMIGLGAGFGQNSKAWTEGQRQQILEMKRRGMRRFYVPPVLPGERESHQWGFLMPVREFKLEAAVYEYDLPDDFGYLEAPVTYANEQAAFFPEITEINDYEIRRRLQVNVAEGRPQLCAVVTKDDAQTVGTRWQIMFWPVPDEAYEVLLKYRINPDVMGLVIGGTPHYQTALESCLWEADIFQEKKQSNHEKLFYERLQASVSYDRMQSVPSTHGFDADRSDARNRFGIFDVDDAYYQINLVRYKGVTG